jgi:hypothetical protein
LLGQPDSGVSYPGSGIVCCGYDFRAASVLMRKGGALGEAPEMPSAHVRGVESQSATQALIRKNV